MATDDIERLHYYQRQYLGALDFEDQQAYHRDMRRRLNLAHHTWGIVTGLELVANGANINITPGMAIDGFGREIVMFTPTALDPALFRSFHGAGDHIVCLEYTEALTQSPQAGYGQCDQSNQFSRVGENFQVIVQDPSRDDIMVNGQAIVFPADPTNPNDANNPKNFFKNIIDKNIIDPEDMPILSSASLTPSIENMLLPLDESVPYQELPPDDPAVPPAASWLIPLGKVSWDGTTGKQQFTGTSDEGRHYIGSVASRLLTPARNLIVRDRSRNTNVPLPAFDPNNPPVVPDGVVMAIEGSLQVDRLLSAQDDIQIHDHALDFRSTGDDSQIDSKKLFTISRKAPGNAGGTDLRLKIGVDNQGKNRFVVGTTDANDLFIVDDLGNVYPTGALNFGNVPRQMIILWSSQDKSLQNGIGIQAVSNPFSATTYFRSSNDFYWYNGGIHSNNPGDTGSGGTILMKLDASGGLTVSGTLGISGGLNVNGMLNANGGLTLNGTLNASGGLVVDAPVLTYQSTTNPGFYVTLGKPGAGVHGADSIYGSPNLWLDTDGAVIAKQGFRMSPMNGAAFFPTGTPAPNNGDVVVLDKSSANGSVIPSQGPNDTAVIGVAITNPGFILANQPYSSTPEGTLVALIGIVQCNVDNTTNLLQINIGDLLTTSSTQGYAQIVGGATSQGAVFGKALEVVPALQQKTIKVLLMPS